MYTRKNRLLANLAVINIFVLLFAGYAYSIPLDDFKSAQTLTVDSLYQTRVNSVFNSGSLGGRRTLSLRLNAGIGVGAMVSPVTWPDVLSYQALLESAGTVKLNWDKSHNITIKSNGLNGANVKPNGEDRFRLRIVNFDYNYQKALHLRLRVYKNDSTNYFTYKEIILKRAYSNEIISIKFSDMSLGSAFDFANIGALQLELIDLGGNSLIIDCFETSKGETGSCSPTTPTPTPTPQCISDTNTYGGSLGGYLPCPTFTPTITHTATATPTRTPLAGDFNNDGCVDEQDYAAGYALNLPLAVVYTTVRDNLGRGCSMTPTPTSTFTHTATKTSTATKTPTRTATKTSTASKTPTVVATVTSTATYTNTITATSTPTRTATRTATHTPAAATVDNVYLEFSTVKVEVGQELRVKQVLASLSNGFIRDITDSANVTAIDNTVFSLITDKPPIVFKALKEGSSSFEVRYDGVMYPYEGQIIVSLQGGNNEDDTFLPPLSPAEYEIEDTASHLKHDCSYAEVYAIGRSWCGPYILRTSANQHINYQASQWGYTEEETRHGENEVYTQTPLCLPGLPVYKNCISKIHDSAISLSKETLWMSVSHKCYNGTLTVCELLKIDISDPYAPVITNRVADANCNSLSVLSAYSHSSSTQSLSYWNYNDRLFFEDDHVYHLATTKKAKNPLLCGYNPSTCEYVNALKVRTYSPVSNSWTDKEFDIGEWEFLASDHNSWPYILAKRSTETYVNSEYQVRCNRALIDQKLEVNLFKINYEMGEISNLGNLETRNYKANSFKHYTLKDNSGGVACSTMLLRQEIGSLIHRLPDSGCDLDPRDACYLWDSNLNKVNYVCDYYPWPGLTFETWETEEYPTLSKQDVTVNDFSYDTKQGEAVYSLNISPSYELTYEPFYQDRKKCKIKYSQCDTACTEPTGEIQYCTGECSRQSGIFGCPASGGKCTLETVLEHKVLDYLNSSSIIKPISSETFPEIKCEYRESETGTKELYCNDQIGNPGFGVYCGDIAGMYPFACYGQEQVPKATVYNVPIDGRYAHLPNEHDSLKRLVKAPDGSYLGITNFQHYSADINERNMATMRIFDKHGQEQFRRELLSHPRLLVSKPRIFFLEDTYSGKDHQSSIFYAPDFYYGDKQIKFMQNSLIQEVEVQHNVLDLPSQWWQNHLAWWPDRKIPYSFSNNKLCTAIGSMNGDFFLPFYYQDNKHYEGMIRALDCAFDVQLLGLSFETRKKDPYVPNIGKINLLPWGVCQNGVCNVE